MIRFLVALVGVGLFLAGAVWAAHYVVSLLGSGLRL